MKPEGGEPAMHDEPPGSRRTWALVVAAAVVGPATAVLHELDIVSLGPAATLWPLLAIVLATVLGIVLGLRIGHRDSRRLRWVAMIPNGLVLLFYGFLFLFFGLGGSR